jgi:hypothetical protein
LYTFISILRCLLGHIFIFIFIFIFTQFVPLGSQCHSGTQAKSFRKWGTKKDIWA